MKKFIKKVKEDIDGKTSGPPVLNGRTVELFILRVLLMVLCYVLINSFIIPIKIWQFVLIDMIIQTAEYVVKIAKKK